MENKGLVSIIMPSYNTAEYIGESILSVLGQTYPYWELLIVDDCSGDNTDEVVGGFSSDERIRYLKNEKNSGAAVSRNRALREAKGKWIAFLDSDDVWHREKLAKQIDFMLEKGCSISYTEYEEMDEQSNALGVRVSGPGKITKGGIYRYCWMGCLTVMYDAEVVGLIQIEDIKKNNDYAMWLSACPKADTFLLGEVLAFYRKRSGSISRHSIKTMMGWHYKLWRDAEKKSIPAALWYTAWNMVFGLYKKLRYVKRKPITFHGV